MDKCCNMVDINTVFTASELFHRYQNKFGLNSWFGLVG